MPSSDASPVLPGNVPEYSVSQLSIALKRTLEDGFGHVRLRGEVSGFKRHGSGHCYFSLKDEHACIDAVCFKREAGRLRFRPEDGLEVVAEGRITTYQSRSKYQIVVDHMAPAGAGALMALLEERKKKLAALGLFDQERKRPLPYLPRVIGIVTSPTGAVIRDILHRLEERFPRHVLVWPCAVQGETAAAQIAAAIEGFGRLPGDGSLPRPDLLIVARGGGSIEDLWAFNEEVVVRAAAACPIPLISAVGHETDTTLIDHAADLRAPTPTAAAELAVPVRSELASRLQQLGGRAQHGIERELRALVQNVQGLARGVPDPAGVLGQKTQRLDDAAEDLAQAVDRMLERRLVGLREQTHRLRAPADLLQDQAHRLHRATEALGWRFSERRGQVETRLSHAAARLGLDEVERRLPRLGDALGSLAGRHDHATRHRIAAATTRFTAAAGRLESVSYQSVLARGFALVRGGRGKVVKRAADARVLERLEIEFADGRVAATPLGQARRRAGRSGSLEPEEQGSLL